MLQGDIKGEYDPWKISLLRRTAELLLEERLGAEQYEVARLALSDCERAEYAGETVTPDDYETRALFYAAAYLEVERLAEGEWKERFDGTGEGVEYFLKNTGQKLWEQGVRSIDDIPAAAKDYLDPIIYLPGTKDVWDITYTYGDARINLLENGRFVLRYAALSTEPIFGKFWFADKRLHLRSEDGKYDLVLRDAGGSYRFEAEPSTQLTGAAHIPDEALFEGIHQMERYPLEWLE